LPVDLRNKIKVDLRPVKAFARILAKGYAVQFL